MKKGDLITLDDNEKYLLLMNTELEGKKFFYANKVDEQNNTTSEYEIFEEVVEEDGTYMELVEDAEVKELLVNVFTADLVQLASDIEKGKIGDKE